MPHNIFSSALESLTGATRRSSSSAATIRVTSPKGGEIEFKIAYWSDAPHASGRVEQALTPFEMSLEGSEISALIVAKQGAPFNAEITGPDLGGPSRGTNEITEVKVAMLYSFPERQGISGF